MKNYHRSNFKNRNTSEMKYNKTEQATARKKIAHRRTEYGRSTIIDINETKHIAAYIFNTSGSPPVTFFGVDPSRKKTIDKIKSNKMAIAANISAIPKAQ